MIDCSSLDINWTYGGGNGNVCQCDARRIVPSAYLLHCAGVQFVETLNNVRVVEPRKSLFGHRVEQVVAEQFQHVAVAGLGPSHIQIQSANLIGQSISRGRASLSLFVLDLQMKLLWTFVDAAQLDEQPVQATVLQFLGDFVFLHITLTL